MRPHQLGILGSVVVVLAASVFVIARARRPPPPPPPEAIVVVPGVSLGPWKLGAPVEGTGDIVRHPYVVTVREGHVVAVRASLAADGFAVAGAWIAPTPNAPAMARGLAQAMGGCAARAGRDGAVDEGGSWECAGARVEYDAHALLVIVR